jgi:hypothetical protein
MNFGRRHLHQQVVAEYGATWLWTGNLITPMIAHALYDFVALVYLLRVHNSNRW